MAKSRRRVARKLGGARELKMKNLKISDNSNHVCHPDPPAGGEGSYNACNMIDAFFLLRMTVTVGINED